MTLEARTIVGLDEPFYPYLLPMAIHSNRIISRILLRTPELPNLEFLVITHVAGKTWPLYLEIDRSYLPFSNEVRNKLDYLNFLISKPGAVLRSTPKIKLSLLFDTFTREDRESTNKYPFTVDPDDPKLIHSIRGGIFSYSSLNFQKSSMYQRY